MPTYKDFRIVRNIRFESIYLIYLLYGWRTNENEKMVSFISNAFSCLTGYFDSLISGGNLKTVFTFTCKCDNLLTLTASLKSFSMNLSEICIIMNFNVDEPACLM